MITCRFGGKSKLVYEINYFKNENKKAIIDAHTGEIYEDVTTNTPLLASTFQYGTVFFNNYNVNGVSHLSSHDNRIRIYQGFNTTNWSWLQNLIPTTTNSFGWDNGTVWDLSKQALYVTEKVDNVFSTHLNITFPEIKVGTYLGANAFAGPFSNADIVLGTLNNNPNGANFALYDIVAHELGHVSLYNTPLYYTPGSQNATLHEGLADVYGTYVESFILGSTDWRAGGENSLIFDANLNRDHSVQYCYDPGSTSDHEKGKAISHWFYAITVGIPGIPGMPETTIESIGSIEDSKTLVFEAVNRLNDPYSGIFRFKELTLQVAEESYGLGSPRYNSVSKAWDRVCITTQCPENNDDLIIRDMDVRYDTDQFISGNIIVEQGRALTIDLASVHLKQGKYIKVLAGGNLVIKDATLNACNGSDSWQGIILEQGSRFTMLNSNIYYANTGIHFKGNVLLSGYNQNTIIGNQHSQVGIKFDSGFGTKTFYSLGYISGFEKGVEINGNGSLISGSGIIENCEIGFDVSIGRIEIDDITVSDCPLAFRFENGAAIIKNLLINGNFYLGILGNLSVIDIQDSEIGTAENKCGVGIDVKESSLNSYNTNIYCFHRGVKSYGSFVTVSSSTIHLSTGLLGVAIWDSHSELNTYNNNTIISHNYRPSVYSVLNNQFIFQNNSIFEETNSGRSISCLSSHSSTISQNIIEAGSSAAISINNSADNTMECNIISSASNGIDIHHNSDLHTIKGNTINASNSDLQIQSVLGEQPHHGNTFVGGTAEAVGLDDQEIRQSQFKVDPTFPDHLPTNPIPNVGWFEIESNPKPFNCVGRIIGPNSNDALCEYWKKLKKIKDTKPNRFFINLHHLLQRAKRDTSFKLPDCIKLDPLLAQWCGAKKISDIFVAITKPLLDKSQVLSIRQLSQQYLAATDPQIKEEISESMSISFQHIKNVLQVNKSKDSLCMDSIRTELNLIHCDSIIIQKWKEIMLQYTKFRQNDSVDVADRSSVLAHSMLCADSFGDAVYLARIMAETFTDQDFDQYDGCISPPPALPKVSAIHDIFEDFNIAPNPTNGLISIDFSQSFNGLCKVMDITGKQIILKSFFDTNNIEFDLSDYPGFNLIQVTSKQGNSKVFKVLVIK